MAIKSLELNGGYKIPIVGLGTWLSKTGEVEKAVEYAITNGYRHIDCAWYYGNENEVGKAVALQIKENKIKREDIFLTSKLWNTFHNPKDVRSALMESLKALQTEYLDLYLMHWPVCYINNGEITPKDKNGSVLFDDQDYVNTWKAMEELQKEGLVRNIGVSNFNIFQLRRIMNECSIKPAVLQAELHPYLIQSELVDFCKKNDIVVVAYFPLGSPGRPWASKDEPVLLEDPDLQQLATSLNKTIAQVLLRFQIQRKIVVIPKSVTPSRIQSNIQLFDFELTKEDMAVIAGRNRNFRTCFAVGDKSHKYFPFQENYSEGIWQ